MCVLVLTGLLQFQIVVSCFVVPYEICGNLVSRNVEMKTK